MIAETVRFRPASFALTALAASSAVWLGAAGASAASQEVRDAAGLFKPETVAKANELIAEIYGSAKPHHDVIVETAKALPPGVATGPAAAEDIVRTRRVSNGVVIFLTPKTLGISTTREAEKRVAVKDIDGAMMPLLRKGNFDDALLAGLRVVRDGLGGTGGSGSFGSPESPAKSARPAAPAPVKTGEPASQSSGHAPAAYWVGGASDWTWVVGIILVVLVVWVVFAVIRAIAGALFGGAGFGGFGAGLLAGLFGAALGGWLFSSFFGGGWDSTAYGASGSDASSAGNDEGSVGGTGGGDFGDSGSSGGGDFGDSGGGSAGGDFGGGDFGGGDDF